MDHGAGGRKKQGPLPRLAVRPVRSSLRVLGVLGFGLIVVVTLADLMLDLARACSALEIDQFTTYAGFLIAASGFPIVLAKLGRSLLTTPGSRPTSGRPVWLSPVVAWAALSLGVASLVLVTHRLGSDFVTRSAHQQLQSVAKLKETQVRSWLDETAEDLRNWTTDPGFGQLLGEWRQDSKADVESRLRLLKLMWHRSESSNYVEIGIRDAKTGATILTTTGDAESPTTLRQAVAASSSPSPILEDLHLESRGEHAQRQYLGFFIGVAAPPSVGPIVVHVAIDPGRELFPLLEHGTAAGPSADVLLVRRQDQGVLILNEGQSRQRRAAAAVAPRFLGGELGRLLLQGQQGFISARDEHDEAMLAFALPIKGTPWLLVTRLDEADALDELNRIFGIAAAIGAILFLLGVWWWTAHRGQLVVERELEVQLIEQAQQLTLLSRRIVSVQEDERRLLAAELHDRIGGNLAAIQLNLKFVAKMIPDDSADKTELMAETGALISDTIVNIREFCNELRPAILDYAGLSQAIENTLERFTRRTGIAAEFEQSGFSERDKPEVESGLFRIVQEALTNIAKHSRASRVVVRIDRSGGQLTMTIVDDGIGFAPEALGQNGLDIGSGLLNMRERALFAGGNFSVESQPGHGTAITVRLG
jgi:signal transduction histidine kinase